MNKYIKILCESFFDDIEDEISVDYVEDVATKYEKDIEVHMDLVKCKSEGIAIAEIDNIWGISERVLNIYNITKNINTSNICSRYYMVNAIKEKLREYNTSYNVLGSKNLGNLYINFKTAVAENGAYNICITTNIAELHNLPPYPLFKIIQRLNSMSLELYPININNVVKSLFPVLKLIDLNLHAPVTYKISQKDIDRMQKVRQTGKWAGFTAITKIDKLVPRYAAYLKLLDSMEYSKYTDKLLIKFLTENIPGQSYNKLISDKVYLKDIVATINNN